MIYDYNRLLEKFFSAKIISLRKWLHAVGFLSQLLNQNPRVCSQTAALRSLNSRVQSRALSSTPSHSTSQMEALLNEDKYWRQWMIEGELHLLYKQAVHADLLRSSTKCQWQNSQPPMLYPNEIGFELARFGTGPKLGRRKSSG